MKVIIINQPSKETEERVDQYLNKILTKLEKELIAANKERPS